MVDSSSEFNLGGGIHTFNLDLTEGFYKVENKDSREKNGENTPDYGLIFKKEKGLRGL